MADENGTPTPPPVPEPAAAAEAVPPGDRLMGLFTVAVAVFILAVGIDLLTGGALSRLIPVRGGDDDTA
jgi:hypothetical protein